MWQMRVDWDAVDEDHTCDAFNFKLGSRYRDMVGDI